MTTESSDSGDTLLEVLERARAVGFLGPGPLRAHLDSARGFAAALPAGAERLVDLGTGGGVPALPILRDTPGLRGTLVEAMAKRATFLTWALAELGLGNRVDVVRERAEVAAHDPAHRGSADVVTARGFGPPAVTAECAVGFLRVGGWLVVSEPPEERHRWPTDGVGQLGLGPAERRGSFVRLQLVAPPPADVPRPTRNLVKRPLF